MLEKQFCKHQTRAGFLTTKKMYVACIVDPGAECPYKNLAQAKQYNCSNLQLDVQSKQKCGCMEGDYIEGSFVYTIPLKHKHIH